MAKHNHADSRGSSVGTTGLNAAASALAGYAAAFNGTHEFLHGIADQLRANGTSGILHTALSGLRRLCMPDKLS